MTESVGRFDAALVTHNQPRHRQGHVQRMLHVVIRRVATLVAGILTGKQPREVVEGKPELVEKLARSYLAKVPKTATVTSGYATA